MYSVTKIRRKKSYRANWLETAKADRSLLGLVCERCGSTDRVERHHIIHKANKGRDCPINLMLLCYYCHRRKHKR